MLIDFRVENHRSLRDEQALSMESAGHVDTDDTRPRTVDGHSKPLLTVAGLYGANASGKSNVAAALAFMRDAVVFSHRVWEPGAGVPREPFAWGAKRSEPSLFEVTLLLDGVRYEFGFEVSDEKVTEEWLYAWPHGKKQTWYERDGDTFKFGEHLRGENRLIEEVTRPNALFLSVAVQHKHSQLSPVYSWFRSAETMNLRQRRPIESARHRMLLAHLLDDDGGQRSQMTLFPEEVAMEPLVDQFRTLLKNADIGIEDVRRVTSRAEDSPRAFRSPRFELRHRSSDPDAWLPLEEESRGTQTIFHIAAPLLLTIQSGALLLVDELEASLHPTLAQEIVRQFNDPERNPHHSQLIFTTHDTNLLGTTLGESVLRRDQVWLTEKDDEGATKLYPLTDFKPRKAENMERGYLQGRYGAVPFLGDFALLPEGDDGAT